MHTWPLSLGFKSRILTHYPKIFFRNLAREKLDREQLEVQLLIEKTKNEKEKFENAQLK